MVFVPLNYKKGTIGTKNSQIRSNENEGARFLNGSGTL